MKTCTKCRKQKLADSRWYYDGWCRSCYDKDLRTRNPEYQERQRKNSREWHERNKESQKGKGWEYHLKRSYGLTSKDYFDMLESQGGGCKLCGRLPNGKNKMPVDHNHKTGKVRGILCTPCNRALGILEDNIDGVLKYLEKV